MQRSARDPNDVSARRGSIERRSMRANGLATRAAVREAAVDLFYQYGYRSVSLRTLAGHVGLQAGSLYNHIANKQDLLFLLLKDIMEEILENTNKRIAKASGVLEQLHEFVQVHLEFHTVRLKEVFIGNSELRNLEPENYQAIVALRREYFKVINDIIEAGARQRLFVVADTRTAARIIMGMLNGVSGWYKVGGEISQRQLIDIYLTMIFRTLGAPLAISESPKESSPETRDSHAISAAKTRIGKAKRS
jgi:AcrR family transcriptional regulator